MCVARWLSVLLVCGRWLSRQVSHLRTCITTQITHQQRDDYTQWYCASYDRSIYTFGILRPFANHTAGVQDFVSPRARVATSASRLSVPPKHCNIYKTIGKTR
jgi:hypothetical protein